MVYEFMYQNHLFQHSAVESARNLREQARLWERADRVEQAEYRDFKRQQRLQESTAG